MSQKNDVTEVWRTVLGEMERSFNGFANQAMGSQEFSRMMNQVGGASLGVQKAFGDLIERYLTSMNLPTRAQLDNVGERLRGIEDQLRDIRSLMAEGQGCDDAGAAANPAAPQKPTRTKRPPSTDVGQP